MDLKGRGQTYLLACLRDRKVQFGALGSSLGRYAPHMDMATSGNVHLRKRVTMQNMCVRMILTSSCGPPRPSEVLSMNSEVDQEAVDLRAEGNVSLKTGVRVGWR